MNRIMKLAGFIRWGCCFLCIALLAMSAEAQTKGITISVKNTPAKEVLEVLKRDYGYFFLYNEDEVKLDRNVSVSVKDAGIAEVMDKILWKGLDYKVRNRQVIITRTPVQTSRSADMRKEPRPERTITVSGVVTDGSGNQLIGVGVIEKGTKNGVVTDGNGKYEITLHDSGAVLVFTSLGYVSEERSPVKSQVVNVVLKEDFQMLDDVVVVGYGKQKKESITGAISTISKDDLVQTPQANLSNMLVGRMPGLIATQRSGAPGEDYSNLMIRGVGSFTGNASPLIMVDGVERSNFDGIDPNEIESLNILKDASATAVYGVRGANGVILVTTRQGELGAPKVSYSGSFALQQSTALPDYLNSEQYATLYNEAQKNDSVSDGTAYVPRFSEKDIELYRNHKDPIMHPDNDWIDSMLRRFSTRTQHNVNISGGIDRVKYFISGSFFDQTGIYKHTRIDSDHDVNPRATRYNFRSNLDFQVTRDLTARFQFATQISDVKSSGNGNSDIWKGMSWSNPLMSPGIVDGKIITIENAVGSQNPWKWLYNNGYRESRGNNINSAVNIDYDFSQLVTKGLSAKVKIAYDSYYSSVKRHGKVFTDYLARRGDNGELYIFPQSEESIWYNDAAGWGKDRKLYIEAGINYDRAFGSHHISALALYNQSKYWSPSLAYLVPNAYQGIVGRVTYEYASRYLFEFDMGYNGTENFAVGHRFGFFPAVSAGWILTEEDWLPDNEILTYMKIRASYGEVGNDKIGGARFLYLPTSYSESWEELYKYRFGVSYNPTESNAMIEGKMGNPDLTWERARKTNLGLDFNMFKGRLSIQSDVFYEYRDNILANRSTVPDIVGADLPAYNLGVMENYGFEFDGTWRHSVREFSYWLRGNLSFARNRIVSMDEVDKKFAYQAATGRRNGQFFGLIFDGYYNSWEEINALDRPVSAWSSNQLQPGDCRYVDVNKDGRIDEYDYVPIGYSNIPEIVYGISFGFSWKGFDFSMLFQGASNVSIQYNGRALWPFINGTESAKAYILDRWTPERYAAGEDIHFPRLSINPSGHNYKPSTLWTRDADYFRLKNMEIGYSLSKKTVRKMRIGGLRLFFNGSNLLTFTDVIDLDPEVLSGGNLELNAYPLQKVYNFGMNITF